MRWKTSKFARSAVALSLTVATATWASAEERHHAVFVMTNDAASNEVVAYERTDIGTLVNPQRFSTLGRGSGGTVDPLASQGSLTLSQGRSLLFAVNAGSGTVSVFRVDGAQLELTDVAPIEGSEPNAVAQHGDLVYVLDTAGSSNVVGFHVSDEGKLNSIPNSVRRLSGNGVASASISFSPDGRVLLVTERATSRIDAFLVLPDGTLSAIKGNPSVGPGAFAVAFAPSGIALVSETGPGAANASAISSYSVEADGTLVPVSSSVPTLGTANCWNAVTPDGRFAYTSNAGSSNISGFALTAAGALSPLPGTVVGSNPNGATNIDIAISADGLFLYSLNAKAGTIGVFAIAPAEGTLTNLGTIAGLPPASGLNGLAAN
jgi:6-phosphogluconolactonase (cycloisomerase 2 family)